MWDCNAGAIQNVFVSETFMGGLGEIKRGKWDKNIEKHWNRFERFAVPPISNWLIFLTLQTSSGPTKIIIFQRVNQNSPQKWAYLELVDSYSYT
jgi:hypothetical protein